MSRFLYVIIKAGDANLLASEVGRWFVIENC